MGGRIVIKTISVADWEARIQCRRMVARTIIGTVRIGLFSPVKRGAISS